jgi:CBS domain-containing protein
MRIKRVGSVLVKHEGEIIGIVTESDIVRKVVSVHRLPEYTPVKTIMSSPIISISEETPIFEAASIMEEYHTRHLAVANGQEIVGMVSVRDMLRPVATDEL